MQTEPFPSEKSIQEWTKQPTSFFENLPDKLILEDSDGISWVNLNLYDNFKSKKFENNSIGFSKGSQEIWLMVHGYFVDTETFELLKTQFIPGLFDQNFPQGLDAYQLFNREYSWSPGYPSIFRSNCFEGEIEIGEKKLIKEIVDVPEFVDTEDGDFELKFTEREIERQVPENVIRVKVTPAYSNFLWESEYDASQKDTTSFDVPCKEIIDHFRLEQKEYDGYYFSPTGELVCFDASLSGIYDGLLIRKDYLQQFLTETGLKLFWLGMGAKQFFQGDLSQSWQRWEGFIYFEQGKIYGSLECEKDN